MLTMFAPQRAAKQIVARLGDAIDATDPEQVAADLTEVFRRYKASVAGISDSPRCARRAPGPCQQRLPRG